MAAKLVRHLLGKEEIAGSSPAYSVSDLPCVDTDTETFTRRLRLSTNSTGLLVKPGAPWRGSIPQPVEIWVRSSIGRAPHLQCGGCGFESHRNPLYEGSHPIPYQPFGGGEDR